MGGQQKNFISDILFFQHQDGMRKKVRRHFLQCTEKLMDKVYSASTGHISGAAYREKMVELMGKVYSASTGLISDAAYGEN
jgi:hypothetical protein